MRARGPFFRSLASLHRAGVPWPAAVRSAGGVECEPAARKLAAGQGLPEALAEQVDALDRALLRAGEASGTLEATLERLAARHEEEAQARGRRRAALAYPLLVGHVAALLAALPDLLTGHPWRGLLWTLALLVPVHAWLIWTRRSNASGGSAHPGTVAPRARGRRRGAVQAADARALLALADLHDAGVPLDEALGLAIAAGAGGRVAFDLYRARPRVREGYALAEGWSAVDEETARTLRVGEEAGELGTSARRRAEALAFEVSMRQQRLAAMLPVGLMLLVGAVVAWRVISFWTGAMENAMRF